MRGCIKCRPIYIKCNQNNICTENYSSIFFSLQIYQLIHHAMWNDSVLSWGSPFQLIDKPVLRAVLVSWNYSKKFLYDSNTKSFLLRKLFASRNQMDWPPYIASVLDIKREQTCIIIGWTTVVMVTEENIASIVYLKTAAPSVDQLYYHKFLIWSVPVALSVTISRDTKNFFLWAWTFSYNSWNSEWILLLFC